MAKNIYMGIAGRARKVNSAYIGIAGRARKVVKGYIGIAGKARLFYEKGGKAPGEKYEDTSVSLSRARLWMGRAIIGDNLLLAGGTTNGSTKVNVVDAINGSLTRTVCTTLSASGDQVGSTWNANYAIFIGGFMGQAGGWASSTKVDAYNSSLVKSTGSDVTNTTASMVGARCGTSGQYGVISDSKQAYLFNGSLSRSSATIAGAVGGQNGGAGATVGNYAILADKNSVDAYNTSGSKTTFSAITGSNPTCGSQNDSYACFISGNSINLYNSSGVKTTGSYGTAATYGISVCGKGNSFIVGGGANSAGSAQYDSAFLINNSGSATNLNSFTTARWNHSSGCVGDYAVFAGGCEGSGSVTSFSSCEIYTI